ncbi:metallophosphoesterase family protein [Candidatus Woesearchaeota archaeon]|nr:metallophosphoesterase family protein [Candidatus Woesearchaeota archaeon]
MNIYCFSDFHNRYELLPQMGERARNADLIVCAGDPTVFEFDLDKTLNEFSKWRKPVLLIHGNHEEARTLREACKRYRRLSFVHGEEVVQKGVRLLLWGGGGFGSHDKGLEEQVKEWAKSAHAALPTVLVTHAPPDGTKLDRIHGKHVGNRSVNQAIKLLKPLYAVSGHIHEAEGAEDEIGNTACYNLGPLGRIITIG